jgi:hypothetical protein
MLCFGLFAIRIGEFADKVKRVSALLPGLGNIGPNRSSRTANLIRQGVGLRLWKFYGDLEDLSLQLQGSCINTQIPKARDPLTHFPPPFLEPTTDDRRQMTAKSLLNPTTDDG